MATCAGLKLKARFVGVKNLVLKESDRVEAMREELMKIGAILTRVSDDEVCLASFERFQISVSQPVVFDVHSDHRIAMALAPLALRFGNLCVIDPQVVEKSYPRFWSDFRFFVV